MIRSDSGKIEIFGHREVMQALNGLPLTNVLLVGPWSVGKRSMLENFIQRHGVTDVTRVYDLKSADLQEVRKMSLETNGARRVIFLRLDRMTQNTEERLLKIIEDAPPEVTFLATSTYSTRIALRTRFTYITVGSLDPKTIAMILGRLGYEATNAVSLAEKSIGSVGGSIKVGKASPFTSLVTRALKCIVEHDVEMLDSLYSKWEDGHTDTILTWASERITERWRTFKPGDFPELGKGTAMRILTSVDRYDRPRYVVRSSLVNIVREDRK